MIKTIFTTIYVYRKEIKINGKTNNMSIELKNWKIDYASHQYSGSSPISGSLIEWIG